MSTYYSTVFLAVLALFGLQLAAVFYVAQVVQSRFTTRRTQKLLTGSYAWGFWIVGFITLAGSAVALLAETFSNSYFGEWLVPYIHLARYGVIPLVGLALTFVLFLKAIWRYSRYLSPTVAVDEIAKALTPEEIRNLAIFRLDVQAPKSYDFNLAAIPGEVLEAAERTVQEMGGARVLNDAELETIESERKKAEGAERSVSQRIEQIKQDLAATSKAGKLDDPITELSDLAVSMLRDRNLYVWRAIFGKLCDAFREAADQSAYAENDKLPFRGDDLLVQPFRDLFEEAGGLGRTSFSVEIVSAARIVASDLLQRKIESRAYPFFELIRDIGDRGLRLHDHILFNRAIEGLTQLAADFVGVRDSRDELTRQIGWLGERLLRRGIEHDTRIPNRSAEHELKSVVNCIYWLTNAINESEQAVYPDILAYVIEILCDALLKMADAAEFESQLISLLGDYGDLAEQVVQRQQEYAELFVNTFLTYLRGLSRRDWSKFREMESDLYTWVKDLIVAVMPYNRPLRHYVGRLKDGGGDLFALIIERLSEFPNASLRDGEMMEVFIKSHGSKEEPLKFLRRASAVVNSSFGLNLE